MMKSIFFLILVVLMSASGFSQTNVAEKTLKFDGNSAVNFGSVNFGFTNQLTIMLWVKWDTLPASGNRWANIASINSTSAADDGVFWIQHNNTNSKFEFCLSTISASGSKNRSIITSTTTVEQGVWYHIAVTYNGSKMVLYVNGVQEATMNKTGTINAMAPNYNFTMGSWAHPNNFYRKINASIDEMSVRNVALSATEIQNKMNYRSKADEVGLVGYWRFDEPNDSIIRDLSVSGFNASNNGTSYATAAIVTSSTAPIFEALPVSLISFNANCGSENEVSIEWATATEINNNFFTIYRSFDGLQWEAIAQVDGAGNSNERLDYVFVDLNIQAEVVYYKMIQTDFDGKTEQFAMVSASCNSQSMSMRVFPNPAQTISTVTFTNPADEPQATIRIINQYGMLVYATMIDAQAGNNAAELNVDFLPAGQYFMQVSCGTNQSESSFIKM